MDRFWCKVDIGNEMDCWEWLGAKQDGYGIFGVSKTDVWFSHRYSWRVTNNQEIPDGLVIRHTCDNRGCVNPNHLLLGTQKDNVMDMIQRNRRDYKKGVTHHRAKLTQEQVDMIRASPKSSRQLSNDFSVSLSTIKRIRNYTYYR